jgi:hypothetical protein
LHFDGPFFRVDEKRISHPVLKELTPGAIVLTPTANVIFVQLLARPRTTYANSKGNLPRNSFKKGQPQ